MNRRSMIVSCLSGLVGILWPSKLFGKITKPTTKKPKLVRAGSLKLGDSVWSFGNDMYHGLVPNCSIWRVEAVTFHEFYHEGDRTPPYDELENMMACTGCIPAKCVSFDGKVVYTYFFPDALLLASVDDLLLEMENCRNIILQGELA